MRNLPRILYALCMAVWGHRHQRDKAGRRYIWHLVRVAWIAYGLHPNAEVVVVGLLHDYIEDVDPEGYEKLCQRFGTLTAASIYDLTHATNLEYADYIHNILTYGSGTAQIVKMADLLDNTQPGRNAMLYTAPIAAQIKGRRYKQALEALNAQRIQRAWGTRP